MSNFLDDISCAYDKVKDFVVEHPLQTAAMVAFPIAGPAILAGEIAAEAAAKKALPALTIGEAAAIGAGAVVGGAVMVGGIAGAGGLAMGIVGMKAVEGAVKAAAEAAKHGHVDAPHK